MADERRDRGTLFKIVEVEGARGERRVSHIQADADRGVIHRRDLLRQLGGPDGVIVDRAAEDGQLGVVVFDGDSHAELRARIPRLPQGGPFRGELVFQAVPGVARPRPLAGVADDHAGTDVVCEPDAGPQAVALEIQYGQVHQIHLERGMCRIRQVRLEQQLPHGP